MCRTVFPAHNDSQLKPAVCETTLSTQDDRQLKPAVCETALSTHDDSQLKPAVCKTTLSAHDDSQLKPAVCETALSTHDDSQLKPAGCETTLSAHNDSQLKPAVCETTLSAHDDSQLKPAACGRHEGKTHRRNEGAFSFLLRDENSPKRHFLTHRRTPRPSTILLSDKMVKDSTRSKPGYAFHLPPLHSPCSIQVYLSTERQNEPLPCSNNV